jgi:hypothetical protein
MDRTIFTPGVSRGTMICVMRLLSLPLPSVRHMTMKKSARSPFEVNHLWPLMTQTSPSRRAVVLIARGSDPAESGSVMEKPDSIRPSVSGTNHCRFCSSVAVLEQDLLVAGVRRHHAEQRRRAQAVGEDLVHVGVLEEREPGPAVLRRQVRCPQAGLLHLRLDRLAQLVGRAPLGIRRAAAAAAPQCALVGQDVAVDDARRELADLS